MKKTIILIGVVICIVLLVALWVLTKEKEKPQTQNGTSTVFPIEEGPQPVPNQGEGAGTEPVIASAFTRQIENSHLITLGGTIVESMFALQMWGDEHKGGEALLRYTSSDGWMLVSMGGGAWSVESLMYFGVPQDIAERLIAGRLQY